MSNLVATPPHPERSWSLAALGLALVALAVYAAASVVDDGLYTLSGALGISAFVAGLKGRRAAKGAGAGTWSATTAIVLGGLLGGAVAGSFVGWVVYHLVS